MTPDNTTAIAAQLMSAFASRTGLYPGQKINSATSGPMHLRFAIFFELFKRTGDELNSIAVVQPT